MDLYHVPWKMSCFYSHRIYYFKFLSILKYPTHTVFVLASIILLELCKKKKRANRFVCKSTHAIRRFTHWSKFIACNLLELWPSLSQKEHSYDWLPPNPALTLQVTDMGHYRPEVIQSSTHILCHRQIYTHSNIITHSIHSLSLHSGILYF